MNFYGKCDLSTVGEEKAFTRTNKSEKWLASVICRWRDPSGNERRHELHKGNKIEDQEETEENESIHGEAQDIPAMKETSLDLSYKKTCHPNKGVWEKEGNDKLRGRDWIDLEMSTLREMKGGPIGEKNESAWNDSSNSNEIVLAMAEVEFDVRDD